MAPRREPSRFARSWTLAREQGMSRKAFADATGIPRGRLNDLILGRDTPTLGETAKLAGRRNSTLIRYRDIEGNYHGFYTGRGMSLEHVLASGELPVIAEEQTRGRYADFAEIVEARARTPKFPSQVSIYPINRTLREQTRRR